jgi:branched-chain amino acid transport system substrate-binding protein
MLPKTLIFSVCLLIMLRGGTFAGAQNDNAPLSEQKTINIGLLIQDSKLLSARYGAEMAVAKANAAGDFKGVPFHLEVLSMEGPWGTGSKQAVDLIFQKEVVAIVASNDGRNAHLVEQVAARTRVVFLSAWSGDPTLAKAFVPWYFNCAPDYLKQADVLIKEIYTQNKLNLVAAVSDSSYDSKLALESYRKRMKVSGKPEPEVFSYGTSGPDLNTMTDNIIKSGADGIVLFCQQDASLKIINQAKLRKPSISIFGSLSVMSENEFNDQEWKSLENTVLINSGQWFTAGGKAFREEFRKKYGYNPGPVAAYAYDAMNVIIKALRNAGTTREEIQKYLKKNTFNGITGTIIFDERGNRTGETGMMMVKNGIPIPVER